jgi:hypothetical protein
MQRMRLGIVAVAACLVVVGGVAPALAGSSGNPQWSVSGSTLGSGETRETKAEAGGTQKLKSGEITVVCSSVGLESGATIKGGSGATPGSGTEQLVYGGCIVQRTSTEEVASGCKVSSTGEPVGTVKSEKLSAKLAYTTPGAAEKEEPSTVSVLKPESTSTFLQLELTGEGCPVPGAGKYPVEGELAMKNIEGNVEKTSHTGEAPSTSVKTYFLNNGGLPKEEKVKGLKVNGSASAVYVGNAVVGLTAGSSWAVTK